MRLKDYMTAGCPTLNANDPIEKAIEFFRTATIHAVPVLENGGIIGIITLASVYQFLSRPGHYASCPVEWIMRTPPVTLEPNSPPEECAAVMEETHIFTLPVMENGALVGHVSVESLLQRCIRSRNL